MVPLTSLWLPVLVSAVFVFLASFVFHMVLPFHRNDYGQVPSEDAVMDALRKFSIPKGDYFLPCAGSPAAMRTPEYKAKIEKGPLVVMTVMGREDYAMGTRLLQWFLFAVFVGILAGYVAGRALPAGASYRTVFRFVGTVAFTGYAVALWQNSIWYSRKWSTTIKSSVDGLIYALLTAGTFGWLWPK